MGCACGTKKDGKVAGCNNNGACGTGGCNKMNVFDWLSNMEMPVEDKFDVAEIRFKNGRKDFYRNKDRIQLTTGDAVVVEAQSGHHIGYVSMQGELVRLQMQKKKVANDDEIKKIYRIANQRDLEKFEETKKRENPTLYRTREVIKHYKLDMKLSDVEYQADNTKATFFYSAEERVDFRELIKQLAAEFKVRVEMRQISLRQEAGRIGGIGVCGRELCCSTWLSDFKNVATSAARYQNLSLNPSKLSGQCGRLKCCLNYELETYMDALRFIPEVDRPLLTEQGEARLQKTDIFRKIMWFGYKEDNNWYPLNVDRVNEILRLNAEGKKPATLQLNQEEVKAPIAMLNSDLESMDKKFKKSGQQKKNKNRNKNQNPNRNQSPQPNQNQQRPNQQNQNQNRGGQNAGQNRGGQNPNQNRGGQNQQRQNRPHPNQNRDRRNNPPRNPNPNKDNNPGNPS
ncbi:MAG: stage 0 sporulation family protein [Bacteroidota bacterium]|jgi:cell fate regulator YaaT (PSP1 superfamily)|nr:Signal peptidase-like protein [Flammeovirgaceae bacterium]